MSTFKRYLVIQAMTFVIGIVGPIFLIGYFASQPDATLKWMYWWGLFITAADVLIALGLPNSYPESTFKPNRQSRHSTTS
jgi:hypothetical protein